MLSKVNCARSFSNCKAYWASSKLVNMLLMPCAKPVNSSLPLRVFTRLNLSPASATLATSAESRSSLNKKTASNNQTNSATSKAVINAASSKLLNLKPLDLKSFMPNQSGLTKNSASMAHIISIAKTTTNSSFRRNPIRFFSNLGLGDIATL